MRFYHIMDAPAPSNKQSVKSLLLPLFGGFLLLSIVAAFDERIALALAIGVIGFAAISMLFAILRK